MGPAALLALLQLPLVIHVTQVDGVPVAGEAQVRAMVAEINGLYRGAGLCFAVEAVRPSPRSGDLVSVRDRVALPRGDHVDGAINVYLVNSIRDREPSPSTARATARVGRKPSGWLAGATIPLRRRPGNYLVIHFGAGARTLAHELGHFLGEGHAKDPTNLMSYGGERAGFDARQLARFLTTARRALRTRQLAAATRKCEEPSPSPVDGSSL